MIFSEEIIQVRTCAADIDLAVAKGLDFFACTRAEVEIEIISSGKRGFLGIGRRSAEVLVKLVDRAFIARHICSHLLQQCGWDVEVQVSQSSEQIDLVLNSDQAGLLIGKQGQNLEALQYLVTSITDRICFSEVPVVLDAGGYRYKRERYLKSLARSLSAKVRASGGKVMLDPLPHHERRLFHQLIRDQRGVTSASVGKGYDKRVIVTPEG